MRDRILLICYLAGALVVTSIHHVGLLSSLLLVLIVLSGSRACNIARKALFAILLFNSIVSISYLLIHIFRGGISYRFLLLVNVRVFLLTYMTFLLSASIDPLRALSFSKTLTFLFTLAFGQISFFRRILDEFHLALASRSPRRPSLKKLYAHRASIVAFLTRKALLNSTEITEAMISRGFFDV